MAAWNSSQPRIEALRARWDRDPSSRLSLQLAEEYRRSGDLDQALHVLRKGIETAPSIAAEVALGRCLLEANDLAAAKVHLGRAIERDPTQMVAYRHLIEVHTRLGDRSEAGAALDIYRQLNPTDPDLGELAARVADAAPAAVEVAPPVVDAASEDVLPPETLSPRRQTQPPSPSAVETASFRPLESAGDVDPVQAPPTVEAETSPHTPRSAAPFVSFLDRAEDETSTADDFDPTSEAETAPPREDPPSRFGFAGEWQPSDVPAEETVPFFEVEDSVFQAPQAGVEEHAVVVDSGELFALEQIERASFELFALPSRPLRRLPGGESAVANAPADAGESTPAPSPTKTLSQLYREQGHGEEADHLDLQVQGHTPSGVVAPPKLKAVDFAPLRQLQAARAAERRRLVVAGYLDRLKEARDVS